MHMHEAAICMCKSNFVCDKLTSFHVALKIRLLFRLTFESAVSKKISNFLGFGFDSIWDSAMDIPDVCTLHCHMCMCAHQIVSHWYVHT